MISTPYKEFHIVSRSAGSLHVIYKAGSQVFTARHQECYCMETAQALIDASLAQKEVQDRAKAAHQIDLWKEEDFRTACELENGAWLRDREERMWEQKELIETNKL